MLRFAFLLIVAVGVVALITRAPGARGLLYALLALAVAYTILKLTGVIDEWAPDRMGYHNTLFSTA